MGALLAMIPLKDLIYGGIIAAILAGGAYFWVHHDHIEQAKGAAAIAASDTKVVTAQKTRDDAIATTTALANSIAQGDYNHEVTVHVHDAPVPERLCDNAARDSGAGLDTGAAAAGGDAEAGLSSANAQPTSALQQFADDAEQIGKDADSQVTALQTIITNLRKQVEQSNVR